MASVLARSPFACFTSAELGWIERIEHVRKAIERSKKIISVRDYGARSPGEVLPEEEMARGIVIQRVIGDICRISSKSPSSCAVLFSLIRQLRPKSCLEMGTCTGISGAYIGAALALNGAGSLLTLEGDEAIANIARQNFAALSLGHVKVAVGPFHLTLQVALADASPVDFMFVDGHHEEHATLRYFEMTLNYLTGDSVVVFDDINWSAGMKRAWGAIASHPACTGQFSLADFGIALVKGQAKS